MVQKITTELYIATERHVTSIKVILDMMPFHFVITEISDEVFASIFRVVKEEWHFWTMIIASQHGITANTTKNTAQA